MVEQHASGEINPFIAAKLVFGRNVYFTFYKTDGMESLSRCRLKFGPGPTLVYGLNGQHEFPVR